MGTKCIYRPLESCAKLLVYLLLSSVSIATFSNSRLNGCIHFCLILSGVHFDLALFVPNQSQYNKLGSNTSAPAEPEKIDLSWQLSLQTVWEKLLQDKGSGNLNLISLAIHAAFLSALYIPPPETSIIWFEYNVTLPSKWCRYKYYKI